ncbi:MAG TPA: DUF1801 domain-containing protein [Patescibacteria group bacterium]|nr:DUF1801 domain-containing protein [Patescibacteria group bacterium]
MKKVRTVDEYISNAPKDVQRKLKELRKTIKKVCPDAEEKISYRMPYFGFKGRLAYFAIFNNHIGLYIPPPVIELYIKELKGYKTAKSTIQFPLDKKLPLALIKKLVKARLKLNEAKL